MVAQDGAVGPTRRDMLKKTALAGGLVWAAPTLLAAPVGAQVTGVGCRSCENNGILYRVKVPAKGAANCGQASIDLRGVYESGPGAPRCGKCLVDGSAIVLTVVEEFQNGKVRRAQLTIDERLRLVEVGAKFVENYTEDCTDNFQTLYNQKDGTTDIGLEPPATFVIDVNGGSVTGDGSPTTIDFYADQDPLNFVDIIVCYAAGGTDFPGCDT